MFHLDLSLLSLGSSSDNNNINNNKTTTKSIKKNKSLLLSDPLPMTLSSSDACSSTMNKTIPTTSASSIRSTISYSLPSPPSSPSPYSLKPSPPSSPKAILENVIANRQRRSRSRSGSRSGSGDISENISVFSSSSSSTINSKKSLTLSLGSSSGSRSGGRIWSKLLPRKKKKNNNNNIYDQKPTTNTKTIEQQQLLPPMHNHVVVRQVEVLDEIKVEVDDNNDDCCGIEVTSSILHQGGKINDDDEIITATARIQVGEYNNIPDLLRYIDLSDHSSPPSSDNDNDNDDYYEIHDYGDGDNGDGCLFGLDIEDDMVDMDDNSTTISFVEPYQPDEIEQPDKPTFAFDDLIMFVNNERKILEYTSDEF